MKLKHTKIYRKIYLKLRSVKVFNAIINRKEKAVELFNAIINRKKRKLYVQRYYQLKIIKYLQKYSEAHGKDSNCFGFADILLHINIIMNQDRFWKNYQYAEKIKGRQYSAKIKMLDYQKTSLEPNQSKCL